MSLQIIVKNSSVSGKEPTGAQLANGEIALNYHADGPFLTCKDSAGTVRRITGVWVNATAPGNPSPGELWLDISLSPPQLKVYKDGTSTWVPAREVYAASTTVAGVVELSTNAETQAGTEALVAVTPASLQSKLSDSVSTTSSTTIATSTAVKAAKDAADAAAATANAALPKSGGTITGNLEIGTTGSLTFEGSTADGFETQLTVVDPTADRTITLPNVSGTVVTTGDTGTVTSTMILDGTIVNSDINASAEIVDSKLATISTADKVSLSALNIDGATDIGADLADADLIPVDDGGGGTNRKSAVTRIPPYVFGKVTGDIAIATNGTASISSGAIVDADISATAEIAVSKLADGAARQVLQTSSDGLGVEWSDSLDLPGTLDVTGVATFDNAVILNSTGYLDLPTGTSAQRPGTPNSGMIRFNSDLLRFEGYNGSVWGTIGGGATGGGDDRVFIENDQTVTTDYTLTTGRNAVTAGPVTVNNGVTVTIPSGSAWVIV